MRLSKATVFSSVNAFMLVIDRIFCSKGIYGAVGATEERHRDAFLK
jgi:hypothetical protein